MFMFLYNQSFTWAQKQANYDYYEPRCIHESSLSPSVHSVLASELGRHQEAYDFFRFATRIDLDNYNRNTDEGIHTTSIAAAWMNIVYGFGGMRSDGDVLVFNPSIPERWESYSFQIVYRGSRLKVYVTQEGAHIQVLAGAPIQAVVRGELRNIDQSGLDIPL
jgi:maltose phosphorylase